MSDIYSELNWRGLVHQTTDDGLPKWLQDRSRVLYIGFDPTADSLHVGSMLQLMTLRRFQRAGHQPIALVGGATGMIGDPSGKSNERQLLSRDALESNVAGIAEQMKRFVDFGGKSSARLVNNLDWMHNFSYLDFLRDVGKNFPVNVMMSKDSVKSRIGREDSGISYTEFSYMLLQAFDFVHLNQEFGCELQVGGSDQWGNITAGIDLGRRMHSVQLFGMTGPLLTKTDGTKMGKTVDGAVWLSADRTSPYAFYQYWFNVADEDAGKCLRFLTELPEDTIEELDSSRVNDAGKRESQKRLAQELTRLVHGDEGLQTALKAKEIFFGGTISGWSDKGLNEIFSDVPSCKIARSQLEAGYSVVDAFVESGLCKSKGDARRTVKEGGVNVNNERINDAEFLLTRQHLASESVIVLRRGKKNFALVKVN